MHDNRNRFLLLLVAVLALAFAPVALAQDQGTAGGQQDQDQQQDQIQDPDTGQDQLQQNVRDQIQLESPDVEIAHNDAIDDDGSVTHNDRLVVETVFSDGPGWLVVYAMPGAQDQAGFQTAAQCGVAQTNGDADADDDLDDDADDDLDDDADDDLDGDDDADANGQANREQVLGRLGIVGYAHLQNGVNRGIEVPVDAGRATQALCLQIHRDTGEVGAFEFPGADDVATGGLLINVIGGRLDEQGQLLTQDQDQDMAQDQDQDTDMDQDADVGQDADVEQDQQPAQDQLQQNVRDRIQLESPDVEIAHNDAIDDDGNVTHDDRLVVETVFSDGPGWLVVYAMPGAQDQAGFQTAAQCGVAQTNGDADADDDLDDDADDDLDGDDDADDDGNLDADASDDAQAGADADADAAGQANREQVLSRLGIVGYAHLQNGVNRGIEVPVDAGRATQALCLQVHRDTGEVGAFEFPGADDVATGGLLINVIGGRLDDQGQLLTQDQDQDDQDQDNDLDGGDDQDEDDDDRGSNVGAAPGL